MMRFAILALATWRLSSLLVNEDGPFKVFYRLRTRAGVYKQGELSQVAELFTCIWCMSIWVAALLSQVRRLPSQALALSAAAIFLDLLRAKVDTTQR